MNRRKHSEEFKAKVAFEAAKEESTINEIASKYGVHPNQVSTWKKELLENLPSIFTKGKKGTKDKADVSKEELYKQIGQLKVELDWVKKKVGYVDK